ncbi:hypothetical protein OEG84_21535 [Hoeflea sp. G2-23]|uniref:Uncharacterized protein n=1 Tax=Hoeflea algicola TaxID=2983763 RepID=A0ABT3ZG60_9HYPH|nr:hypothetical protein [Hoeflea algicola]MCY0150216.1 hypothetical protein [Hoeflea algicola]
MTEEQDEPLSPTVKKVLDAYLNALKEDSEIDDEAAGRLNDLLRKGKVPKPENIDVALFPAHDDKAAS